MPCLHRRRRHGDIAARFGSRTRAGSCWMKVIVTVDCTPLEARTFLGLPDVQPMQTAMMDQMQTKMMESIDKYSPESIMQSWFSFDPKMGERFQEMFVNMAGLGASKDKK
jgi:hypothetical protein